MPRDLPVDITHPTIPASLSKHSVPLSEWKTLNPEYSALAVGAFILRLSPTNNTPQLLLLLRASTDSYPNVWEPPGGSVDYEDATIFHGLVREVWEETGLRVKAVDRQVWHADGSGKDGEVHFPGRRGNSEMWCKLNYVVQCLTEKELGNEKGGDEVEVDYKVVLDDQEHQDWGWFTREEMEKAPFVSDQGREIARNAFKAFEEGLKRDGKL